MTTRCGTCHPPADDTPDREAIDRFADFLRLLGGPPGDKDHPFVGPLPRSAYAYARGEDVDPMADLR